MSDYRYLIVGGGLTGDAACKGIRSLDADGSIGLIGDEPDPPYARPPLSKALWKGKDEDSIWRGASLIARSSPTSSRIGWKEQLFDAPVD